MKKLLSVALSLLMLISVFAFASCNNTPETLKFGMGVYTAAPTVTDADADTNGQGKVAITSAAITVDANGKVVSCDLDTADITVKYTADGKAVANDSFKTKREQGDDYGMVAYQASDKEWYTQADAFETVVKGKTLAEIKALVADGNKGTDEVVNAGCTIMIHEFVKAIEKAFANLADSTATADAAIKVGTAIEQTCKDADEDMTGQNQVDVTFVAAATDAAGKVLVAASDCVRVTFTFDEAGASTFDTTKAIASKREAGTKYGMVEHGGATKEWFEQADAFNTACVGKTATEINALLATNGKGVEALQTAGCTIYVTGLVKAANKAATK